MEGKICQCCAMPMGDTDELYGTNADGSKCDEYCKYCYTDGKIQFEGTMEEMIDFCVPIMVKQDPAMTEETARKLMADVLPTLKHWKR
ncbi:MAG TPA: zinc ribbon domain-containing protein [Candidatus Limiplasma sp.]|nr:zinc ribbon domain-containing protein [Candidatus Limiplasma sp.]